MNKHTPPPIIAQVTSLSTPLPLPHTRSLIVGTSLDIHMIAICQRTNKTTTGEFMGCNH